jgi:hypothetical protein
MADERLPPTFRQAVTERARGCCEYCHSQERFAMQAFALEHVVPRSLGGETGLGNLALACQGSNNHKYSKTEGQDPAGGEQVLPFNPRTQRWRDHFAWNEGCTHILGVTATGRATVEELHLNREGLVNLRRVLFSVGEHPPPETEPA